MLTRYYRLGRRISAIRTSPGGAHLDGYAERLFETGYSNATAKLHIRAAEHLCYWAACKKIPLQEKDFSLPAKFHRHLRKCRCPGFGSWNEGGGLDRCASSFLSYLWDCKVFSVSASKSRADWTPMTSEFREWMRDTRNICDATLLNYSLPVEDFIKTMGGKLQVLSAKELRDFILTRSQVLGQAKMQHMLTGLKAFMRFLADRKQCRAGLEFAIPTIAHWSLASLPHYLQPGDVDRLLESCDLRTPQGIRNKAIMLLLARLALRAGDISNMRVGDIDWENGSVKVCRKSGREDCLPLTKEIGGAIAAYVKKARPKTNSDFLFIRLHPPFCGLSCHAPISALVGRAMKRTGIVRPCKGAAHLLRHTAATAMLREGASLQDVAHALRHRSLLTTGIYAKVDIAALREIALPWPEVET